MAARRLLCASRNFLRPARFQSISGVGIVRQPCIRSFASSQTEGEESSNEFRLEYLQGSHEGTGFRILLKYK